MSKYTEFDMSVQNKYSVIDRESKVDTNQFAKLADIDISKLLSSMPNILKSKDLNELIDRTIHAYKLKKPIIIGIGGHVIKTGLSPILIEMMRIGLISGISANGSVSIHDFEIANFGQTSEDVAIALADGSFGMATDTCDIINNIICEGSKSSLGYGEAIGKYLSEQNLRFPELSLLRNAYEMNIPVTIHVALGTDINHQHNTANGSAIGDCSMRDFRIFTKLVSEINDGGIFICFGSAVVLPEVFLKALTICRNVGKAVQNFTTAVFDMNFHYRPQTNIVSRPVLNSGKGYYFVGHHEIMLPLYFYGLKSYKL
jgi:deoxyhypusine synthase